MGNQVTILRKDWLPTNSKLLVYYLNRLIFNQRRAPNSELGTNYQLDGIDVCDILTGHQFVIRLCRTLGVPENVTVHDIPATFGPLPHIGITKCATDDIPERVRMMAVV